MELLEGSLRERLSGGALSHSPGTIEYALQIASGLAAAHEKGIVHRDLKPENVFVTHEGRIKLLDFGLARLVPFGSAVSTAPTAAIATEPGVVMGTVGYMSPEQVRGRPADHRSDIFSFGAILYEMLSGKRAFHGDSAAETMAAIAKEEPPDLRRKLRACRRGSTRSCGTAWRRTPASASSPRATSRSLCNPSRVCRPGAARRLRFRRTGAAGSFPYARRWWPSRLSSSAPEPASTGRGLRCRNFGV
jgi:serine/threonine protein kinase